MCRFKIFHVALWGIFHLLWRISWVCLIAPRLCEHSNLVRFEKRAAKTLQHGHRYGDILMLCDIKTDFSAITDTNYVLVTNHLTFPAYIIFWSNTLFEYQTRMGSFPIPCYADLLWAVPVWDSILTPIVKWPPGQNTRVVDWFHPRPSVCPSVRLSVDDMVSGA